MRDTGRQSMSKRLRRRLSAWLTGVGTLAVIGLLLTAPFEARGQSVPLRGGQGDEAAPTATARLFRQEPSEPEDQPPLADAVRRRSRGDADEPRPSLRPRPEPAPVTLAPVATLTPEPEPARARPAADRARRTPATVRVWPLAPGTYDISQPFGCVPQLAGYYPVVAGCPSEAPAVHDGLDFAALQGTPIYAAAGGWVTIAGLDRPSGVANTQIVIQHDGANEGYATEYLHWISTYVAAGDYVQAGEAIAEVGSVGYSTGPHLHFSVVDFSTNDRIDPVRWLPATSDSDAYLGRLPGRGPVSFPPVNVPVPDYADPAPPPVPVARPVPEAAPLPPQVTTPEPTPAASGQPAPIEPAATSEPTPEPTPNVDQAADRGSPRNNDDDDRRRRRQRDEEPAPTAAAPPFVPAAPLNPMVTTPVPAAEPADDSRRRQKQRDR